MDKTSLNNFRSGDHIAGLFPVRETRGGSTGGRTGEGCNYQNDVSEPDRAILGAR